MRTLACASLNVLCMLSWEPLSCIGKIAILSCSQQEGKYSMGGDTCVGFVVYGWIAMTHLESLDLAVQKVEARNLT
jgi:hypothetical protein